mgnify:CR=1 FL=1
MRPASDDMGADTDRLNPVTRPLPGSRASPSVQLALPVLRWRNAEPAPERAPERRHLAVAQRQRHRLHGVARRGQQLLALAVAPAADLLVVAVGREEFEPLAPGRLQLGAAEAMALCDENTIGVVAVLGLMPPAGEAPADSSTLAMMLMAT